MNSAKKIMKNGGENATQSTVKQSRGLSKNMILILVGIILVAVLGGGVCYVNLRPRAILTVEGKDAGWEDSNTYDKLSGSNVRYLPGRSNGKYVSDVWHVV